MLDTPNGITDALGFRHDIDATEDEAHCWFIRCTCGWYANAPFGDEQAAKLVMYHLHLNGMLKKGQFRGTTR